MSVPTAQDSNTTFLYILPATVCIDLFHMNKASPPMVPATNEQRCFFRKILRKQYLSCTRLSEKRTILLISETKQILTNTNAYTFCIKKQNMYTIPRVLPPRRLSSRTSPSVKRITSPENGLTIFSRQ